jgi:hypothetical protein
MREREMTHLRSSLTAVLLLLACGVAPAFAEQPSPADLVPCPFTEEEVEALFDATVTEMARADMTAPGGRDVGCTYVFDGSETVLAVRQVWDAPGNGNITAEAKTQQHEPGDEPIPGDPDGATWQVGEDQGPSVKLKYKRGRVRSFVLVHRGAFDVERIKPKMLRLKRVP